MSHRKAQGIGLSATFLLAMAASCASDDVAVEPDAYQCFAGGIPEGAAEAGSVEIGTGRDAYQAVEADDALPLYRDPICNYVFYLRPRIQGLEPGDAESIHSPQNPHTLASAYGEDGDRLDVQQCGYTWPYVEAVGDLYDLGYSRLLQLERQAGETLDGERVRIVVEVLDAEGRYAREEVWVTAELEDADTC